MRKYYIYSLFSQHQNNYVYEPIIRKDTRSAVFSLLKYLDSNQKIIKKCQLHVIGEVFFKSNGKIANITHYLLPKEVHLTNFGKIISLCDYFTWKFKEILCQKFQQILKYCNIIFQKMKPLMQSVLE